jgi:hypothetical protein
MKICLVGAELFHAERQTGMTNLRTRLDILTFIHCTLHHNQLYHFILVLNFTVREIKNN